MWSICQECFEEIDATDALDARVAAGCICSIALCDSCRSIHDCGTGPLVLSVFELYVGWSAKQGVVSGSSAPPSKRRRVEPPWAGVPPVFPVASSSSSSG